MAGLPQARFFAIALRFATDAELPGLARRVLHEKLTEGNAIKRMVQDRQLDFLRA